MMQKIEELTLYVIEQEKKMMSVQGRIAEQGVKLEQQGNLIGDYRNRLAVLEGQLD